MVIQYIQWYEKNFTPLRPAVPEETWARTIFL